MRRLNNMKIFKKNKVIPAFKNPPKVVKESKNYRLVVIETPAVITEYKGEKIVTLYEKQLVLEEKNSNALEEPFWMTVERVYVNRNTFSISGSSITLTRAVLEFFLES